MENNYQLSRIHNYVSGLMNKEDMHALEREALDDPFLQDAIDGYKLQQGVDVKNLSLLQQRLASRVEEHHIGKAKRFNSWQRLTIGMAAAVMFVTVCTFILLRYIPQRQAELKQVEIMQDNVFTISIGNTGKYDGEPAAGWKSFEDYLTANYIGVDHIEGDVHIQFRIDENGQPVDYKLLNRETTGKEKEEILKLIDQGPKWKGTEAEIFINLHKLNL